MFIIKGAGYILEIYIILNFKISAILYGRGLFICSNVMVVVF
jgi:hypothetical protein